MKKLFAVPLFVILLTLNLAAQSVEKLPSDPRIKSGKMANGLTYYIVQNSVIPGYANFYLVQQLGTSLEEPSQKRMTEIVGNMGLRGTRNFPGKTIVSYMDELGLTQERDYGISIGADESLYRISNVPVKKSVAVIDSTLLILFNWSSGINLDEQDVEKEKVLFVNNFVEEMNADKREKLAIRKEVFQGTPYAPLGQEELITQINGYTSKDLRSYYYKWSRPDLQAIVIVGDIDPATIESKIKTLFQASPKYLETAKRNYVSLPDNKGVEVLTVSDKEATASKVILSIKSDPVPRSLRNSAVPYLTDYMNYLLEFLVKDRLVTYQKRVSAPIKFNEIEYGKYFGVQAKDAFTIEIEVAPEKVENVMAFLVAELDMIKKFGFTDEEFTRARNRYMDYVNYRYDWRGITPNAAYAKRCIDNYLYGFSLASIEMHKEYMDKVKRSVQLEQFNTYASTFLKLTDNISLVCTFPSGKGSVELPSSDRLLQVYNTALNMKKDPRVSLPTLTSFAKKEIVPGTIVTETKEPISNSSLWMLSNGANVIFKQTQTEPKKVHFMAVAKGGLSLCPGVSPFMEKYINEIVALGTLGGENSVAVSKMKKDLGIELEKNFSLSLSKLEGKTFSSYLPKLMELAYLNFRESGADAEAFASFKEQKKNLFRFVSNNPEMVFADSLECELYMGNRASLDYSSILDTTNYSKVADFISESFSNAANFTFIIVGDADEVQLKELVCKYIASLPGNINKRESWRVLPFYFSKRDKDNHFTMPMEYPRSLYDYTLFFPVPFNVENRIISGIVSQAIEREVVSCMADLGITVRTKNSFKKYPEEFMTIDFSFVTNEYSHKNVEKIGEILSALSEKGISSEELQRVKSGLKAQFIFREKADNSFWAEILENRFIYGKDMYSRYLSTLDSLTVETINAALKGYIKESNRHLLTMSGSR